uniref:Coiled-coil domain containing 124 n=1 Tax=Sinocyclocheilus anshuiensis TaxID=1608454 RepID=A0A671PL70_9TELE
RAAYLCHTNDISASARHLKVLSHYAYLLTVVSPFLVCVCVLVQDDKERKRLEALERKRENQRLFEEEVGKIKGKQTKEAPGKVTRAQIEENLQSEQNVKETEVKEKSHLEMPLEENVNQIVPEEGTMEARTIEDAIAVLSTKEDLDRHPERRMKAAYAAFEEANMARLKMENPNMRLSQLKQQLKKEWTKSPENPLNQCVATYNSK